MTREIHTRAGYIATVDDGDYDAVSQYRWRAHDRRHKKRPVAEINGKTVPLSHLIMPPPPGMIIDHIDGDPWNNRRSNLRACTYAENARNRCKSRSGKNTYKSVQPTRHGKWDARVVRDRVIYRVGHFATEIEAARAYDNVALYLHGEFARLNFNDGLAVPTPPDAYRQRPPYRPRKSSKQVERAA
jgi:hypothetical protein